MVSATALSRLCLSRNDLGNELTLTLGIDRLLERRLDMSHCNQRVVLVRGKTNQLAWKDFS